MKTIQLLSLIWSGLLTIAVGIVAYFGIRSEYNRQHDRDFVVDTTKKVLLFPSNAFRRAKNFARSSLHTERPAEAS